MHPTFPKDALAAVLDPARVAFHPALMQDAWLRLLEQRQGRTPPDRLRRLQPAHLIDAAEGADGIATAADLLACVDAATPAIRHQIARRGYPLRGVASWLRGQIATPGPGDAA